MKKSLFWVLAVLGLTIPWACSSNSTPTTPGVSNRFPQPTSTPTNLGGYTSTPTATFQPTPPFISGFGGAVTAPNGLAYGNSSIYVAEGDGSSVSQVQVFGLSGGSAVTQFTSYAGTNFIYPNGVAVSPLTGNIYVLDAGLQYSPYTGAAVYELTSNGTAVTSWPGYGGGTFLVPNGIAIDSNGNVYVADSFNNQVEEFGAGGATIAMWTTNITFGGSTYPVAPMAVALDPSNNLFVADGNNDMVWELSTAGGTLTTTNSWNLPLPPAAFDSDYQFYGLAVDASSNVYVADYDNGLVEIYNNSGSMIGEMTGNEGSATPFIGPDGILLANNNIYVSDYDSNTGSSALGIIEIFGPNSY